MSTKSVLWKKSGTQDKIWGIIELGLSSDQHIVTYVTFWGRRGKTLQTKIWQSDIWRGTMTAAREVELKIYGGYNVVNESDLNQVYPEFAQDLENVALWSILKS